MTDGLSWLDRYFGGGGGGGGGAPLPITLTLSAGAAPTSETTFVRVGGMTLDATRFPETSGGLTRSLAFEADVQKTAGATSVDIQLVDVTHGATVTGTSLTSSSTSTTLVASGPLTVGADAGNIRNDETTQYEVQIKRTGGSPADAVFVVNARLVITYA